ncbi:replication protein RepB (plasmid) [Rickettsiales bacterium Ac37b]|nr:replication protein RepB [Rickettsiales bacterium Ac37b]
MKSSEQNNELIKHTAAIHINNSTTTLIARKLFNILLKNAFHNLRKNITHKISLLELSKSIGWSSNSHPNDELKEAIRSMVREQIEFNVLTKDKKNRWGIVTILSGADIVEGVLYYRYDTVLSEMLANPTIYARINMVIQGRFRSKYSLALWEYLTEYLCVEKRPKITTEWVTVNNIRKILGAEEEYYNDFRKLNQKVLSSALKEINKLGDINVDVSYRRKDRKIMYLSFVVHKKEELLESSISENQIFALEHPEEKDVTENVYIKQLQQEFHLPKSYTNSLCQNVDDQILKNAIDAVKEYMSDKKIKNCKAIVKKAITEKWEPQDKSEYSNLNQSQKIITDLDAIENNIIHEGWKAVWNILKQKIDKPNFISWISKLEFSDIRENVVELIVRNNSFVRTRIENEYADQLLCAWKQYNSSIKQVKINLVKEKECIEA